MSTGAFELHQQYASNEAKLSNDRSQLARFAVEIWWFEVQQPCEQKVTIMQEWGGEALLKIKAIL